VSGERVARSKKAEIRMNLKMISGYPATVGAARSEITPKNTALLVVDNLV
jgi:hypothetical protein